MEAKIADILRDIYRIDPELKSREDEIVSLLGELLKTRPDFEPDGKFVEELRRDVLEKTDFMARKGGNRQAGESLFGSVHEKLRKKISFVRNGRLLYNEENTNVGILSNTNQIKSHMENQNENVPKASSGPLSDAGDNLSARGRAGFGRQILKFGVSLGGLLVFIIFVVAVSVWQGRSGMLLPGMDGADQVALSSKVLISSVGDNAFGSLVDLASNSSSGKDTAGNYALGAGGGDSNTVGATAQRGSMTAPAADGAEKIASEDTMIYPYVPTYYTYVYEGGEFSQKEAKMNVLKRVTGMSGVAASIIGDSLDFDLFDLGKLNNAKTSNLSFFEDREYGYRTDIDLVNGSVSIYKNYEKWPNYYTDCRDEECYKNLNLTVDDIPGDEEMIGATEAFLRDYQIDMSAYGAPEVDNGFMNYYNGAESVYVPEEISVIYPLVVDGKTIYESYGDLSGLRVNYDIRNHRVTGMYSLMTHNYQSSAYDAETDTAKILETATGNAYGDMMPMRAEDGTGAEYKDIRIALDTPFLSYESMYRYENNTSSEYLVPCMVFSIKDGSEAPVHYRKRVIVPLIKDFLQNDYDYPVMMKGGVAGSAGMAVDSSAGSGVSANEVAPDVAVP